MITRFFCTMLLLAMAVIPCVAGKPSSSKFTGSIVGPDSAIVAKAKVLIENGKHKWNLESNENGIFKIDLPPGRYQFTIQKLHFKRMIVREFSIASGARVSYEFRLEFGECSDCDRVKPDATEQIVGPERRLHVLHHHWFGER